MKPIHAVHTQTASPAQEQPHAELWLQSLIAELEKREWGQNPGLGEPLGLGRGWSEKGPKCVFPLWEHKAGSQRWGTGSPGAQGQRSELGYSIPLGSHGQRVSWGERGAASELSSRPEASLRPAPRTRGCTWCGRHVTWHRVSGGGSHSTRASTTTSRPSSSITHSCSPGLSWGQRTRRRGQLQDPGLVSSAGPPAQSLGWDRGLRSRSPLLPGTCV